MPDISLNDEPRYGYYPWWPENGNDWVYPEDVQLARQLIPSTRVFRRAGEQGPFVVLHYGDVKLRVLRTLWQEVKIEGFEMGDWVEVLSRCGHNEPRTGTIREMVWNERARRCAINCSITVSRLPSFTRLKTCAMSSQHRNHLISEPATCFGVPVSVSPSTVKLLKEPGPRSILKPACYHASAV